MSKAIDAQSQLDEEKSRGSRLLDSLQLLNEENNDLKSEIDQLEKEIAEVIFQSLTKNEL